MSVDYETIQKIQKLGDDVLVGVAEVAALTGFSDSGRKLNLSLHATNLPHSPC